MVSGNPLLNEQNLSEKQTKWFPLFLPLCLHQQENKQIFTPKCNGLKPVVYQIKDTVREIKQQFI